MYTFHHPNYFNGPILASHCNKIPTMLTTAVAKIKTFFHNCLLPMFNVPTHAIKLFRLKQFSPDVIPEASNLYTWAKNRNRSAECQYNTPQYSCISQKYSNNTQQVTETQCDSPVVITTVNKHITNANEISKHHIPIWSCWKLLNQSIIRHLPTNRWYTQGTR